MEPESEQLGVEVGDAQTRRVHWLTHEGSSHDERGAVFAKFSVQLHAGVFDPRLGLVVGWRGADISLDESNCRLKDERITRSLDPETIFVLEGVVPIDDRFVRSQSGIRRTLASQLVGHCAYAVERISIWQQEERAALDPRPDRPCAGELDAVSPEKGAAPESGLGRWLAKVLPYGAPREIAPDRFKAFS